VAVVLDGGRDTFYARRHKGNAGRRRGCGGARSSCLLAGAVICGLGGGDGAGPGDRSGRRKVSSGAGSSVAGCQSVRRLCGHKESGL